jgi:hypothetical protein
MGKRTVKIVTTITVEYGGPMMEPWQATALMNRACVFLANNGFFVHGLAPGGEVTGWSHQVDLLVEGWTVDVGANHIEMRRGDWPTRLCFSRYGESVRVRLYKKSAMEAETTLERDALSDLELAQLAAKWANELEGGETA